MFDKIVRNLVYLAVIGLCLMRAYSYWEGAHPGAKPTQKSLVTQLIGSRVELDNTIAGDKAKATLVVAMTTSCIYCKASAPFYRRLLAGVPTGIRTIAVFPEQNDIARTYLQDSLDLTFNGVVQHLQGLRVTVTPTVLVLDENGTVKAAWVGLLKPDGEREVVEALNRTAGIQDSARTD
jgi:thiol-disulfide isomerase/thioredoxin